MFICMSVSGGSAHEDVGVQVEDPFRAHRHVEEARLDRLCAQRPGRRASGQQVWPLPRLARTARGVGFARRDPPLAVLSDDVDRTLPPARREERVDSVVCGVAVGGYHHGHHLHRRQISHGRSRRVPVSRKQAEAGEDGEDKRECLHDVPAVCARHGHGAVRPLWSVSRGGKWIPAASGGAAGTCETGEGTPAGKRR